jgi:hypothetical protein
MRNNLFKALLLLLTVIFVIPACKKDKDKDGDEDKDQNLYMLMVRNGAQSVPQGKSITFEAYFVDKFGVETSASSVTWAVVNSAAGSFSGATFTANGSEPTIVTAKATLSGKEYTASVPVGITPPNSLFTVVPSAVIWTTGAGNIDLLPVYVGSGAGSVSYSYSSSNSSVASVSSSGSITFNKEGNANITVSGTINGQAAVFVVPVLVVGEPTVPLPVARIVISPMQYEMFRGETQQFSAKAYDSEGKDVTSTVQFSWSVASKDPDFPNPVSVSNSGVVSVSDLGDAFIYASAKGVTGQAEIAVLPDSILMIEPFFVSLGGMDFITGTPRTNEQVFTAKAYKINRDKYRNKVANFFEEFTVPALDWMLPETGIPQVDDMYRVVTLSNATATSVKATAIDNKMGASVLIAVQKNNPRLEGAAMINVGF